MTKAREKQTAGIGKGTPGPGRKKGVPNKITTSIKGAFLEAFEKRGGVKSLVKWASENETEFYKLAARLIPTEITADVNAALTIRVVKE